MGYPYERFLRFLVSRKIEPDQVLDRYGLPSAGDLWFASTKTDLLDHGPYPISSYLGSKNERLTLRDGVLEWAEREGFRELWEMQPEFGEIDNPFLSTAFQIFINSDSRPVAGMLLLARAPDEQICSTLQEALNVNVTPEVIELYRRLFWDVSSTSNDEWDELIEEVQTQNERHLIALGRQGQDIHTARDALELATDLDIDTMLKEMLNCNHMKWRNAQAVDNDDSMKLWQDNNLRVIREIRETRRFTNPNEGLPTAGDFEGLFSVEIEKTIHPTLAELQGEIAPRTGAKPLENESA